MILLRGSEVASLLGVCVETVGNMAIDGRLPVASTTPAGQRRYDLDEVMKIAKRRRSTARAEAGHR